MERELWKLIVAALKRLPPTRPRNAYFSDRQVLAVFLWAALHDRPTSWACERVNWPVQAWRRKLPDQSTMSRRMRTASLHDALAVTLTRVQASLPDGRLLFTDGKAFELSDRTSDPDAANGRGAGHMARGFRLHVVIDDQGKVCGWDVLPMNVAETVVTRKIIESMPKPPKATLMIADAGYDSNKLYEAAALCGLRMIAPRRKRGQGLGWREHHPHRLAAIKLTEQRGGWMWPMLHTKRWTVERFFAGLVTSGVGANGLPTWVRRLHRVKLWIGAKLVINAARLVRLNHVHA